MTRPTVDRRTFVGSAGAAVVAGLAGCSGNGGSGGSDGGGSGSGENGGTGTGTTAGSTGAGEVTVGVLLPFTGQYDWVGSNVLPVVEMVTDRINANGGIDGRQVSVVQGDTEATVDAGVSAAQKLINVEGADLLIGPTSLTMTGVVDTIQSNEVPTISPTAGTTELDDVGGEFIFRTVPSDSLGGKAIARGAFFRRYNNRQEYRRMALLVGNAPALQSFKEPIRSAWTALGGQITTTVDYATGKNDYEAELTRITNSNPEITVLVGNPEDSERILRDAFQEGYGRQWFVTQDQTTQSFVEEVPSQMTEGILGLTEADSPAAVEAGRVSEFESALQQRTGSAPGSFAKNAFDAINVGTVAMRAAVAEAGEVSRSGVAGAIPRVANPPGTEATDYASGAQAIAGGSDVNYEGLVGPCDFDDTGDIRAPFAIKRSTGSSWKTIGTIPADEL